MYPSTESTTSSHDDLPVVAEWNAVATDRPSATNAVDNWRLDNDSQVVKEGTDKRIDQRSVKVSFQSFS